jgi:6-phosphogluconolactonase
MARSAERLIETGSDQAAIALVGGWIAEGLEECAEKGGRFRLVLTGGETPVGLYDHLARQKELRWDLVDWFWSDERAVPPEQEDSNYRLVRAHLLDYVGHRPERVFRLPGEIRPLEQAASVSTQLVDDAVGAEPFDFTLLGMGGDGHIGSLFPGRDEVSTTGRTVVAVRDAPKPPGERLSLTLPRINNSRTIVVLISGAQKLEIARAIVSGRSPEPPWPAALLDPQKATFVCGSVATGLFVIRRGEYSRPPSVSPP